jgi:AraC family transcriptional regulator
MGSQNAVLEVDFRQEKATEPFLPRPPLLTSYQAGWKSLQLAHFQQNGLETPEMISHVHIIVMANWRQSTEVTMVTEDYRRRDLFEQDDSGCIQIIPAELAFQSTVTREVEFTHCYFEPTFLSQVAYESVDPDKVQLSLMLQQPDPLLWQMGAALKNVLETNPKNSSFYADSIATGFAVHLLTHYATRKLKLREYNGLPKDKLKQAVDYMNAHLGEDISLADISTQLCISQYHFARLFKQSMGITPHAYLIQQRVDKARQLLRQTELTVLDIADQCGFANPSHLAKHFQKQTGITPRQFRELV